MQPPSNPQFLPSGVPSDVGKASGGALGGIEYGALQPVQTICGLRKKVFFVVLAAAIIAIVAGLSTGLGVALSKNNNSTPAAAGTVTVTAGAGADSPDGTTSSRPDSITGSVESTSTSPGDNSSSASPGDTASAPTSDTRSTPTGTTASTTPPTRPQPSEATRFPVQTGFWTITFSKYSSSGDLCTYFDVLHPMSTVIEPYIRGSIDASYVASWEQTSSEVVLTEPSTTVTIYDTVYSATATFAAQAATNVPAWDFRKSIVPTVYGCEFTGSVQLLFEETGRMRYIYSVNLADTCPIGENSAPGGSSCSLYWRLVKSN